MPQNSLKGQVYPLLKAWRSGRRKQDVYSLLTSSRYIILQVNSSQISNSYKTYFETVQKENAWNSRKVQDELHTNRKNRETDENVCTVFRYEHLRLNSSFHDPTLVQVASHVQGVGPLFH